MELMETKDNNAKKQHGTKCQTKYDRLPESERQTVPFSFRLKQKNAEKLRKLMEASGTDNLRVFLEKTVLNMKQDSVVESRKRLVSNSFSKDYYRQFKGVATNLNQLMAAANSLQKKNLMTPMVGNNLAERAHRILDTLEVFLNEKGTQP